MPWPTTATAASEQTSPVSSQSTSMAHPSQGAGGPQPRQSPRHKCSFRETSCPRPPGGRRERSCRTKRCQRCTLLVGRQGRRVTSFFSIHAPRTWVWRFWEGGLNLRRPAAPLALILGQQPIQAFDDLRLVEPQIACLGRVVDQVVQLTAWAAGHGLDVLWFTEAVRAELRGQLPTTLTDRQRAVARLMDDRFAPGARTAFSIQCADDAETIFAGIAAEWPADDFGHGRQQVGQANELLASCALGHDVRIANDEGDSMSALPQVGLLPAPMGVRAMSPGLDVAG